MAFTIYENKSLSSAEMDLISFETGLKAKELFRKIRSNE